MGKLFIELKKITKYFPGVIALHNMDFQIRSGEVHGLIGENGAGKSTLIKVLTGVHKPDAGQLVIEGQDRVFRNPSEAMQAGIGCVYQELNIVPELNIIDNLFIGMYEKKKASRLLDYKYMRQKAEEIMESLGSPVDVGIPCARYGVGVQQMVEIGKAILRQSKLIIMDEPTSSLSEKETVQLMLSIRKLKENDIAVVFVSHKLEEIFEICDLVTVMRDGELVKTTPVSEMSKDIMISQMVGRSLENLFPKVRGRRGEVALEVKNLNSVGVLKNISFKAYKGEILGFAGLVGAGRTELFRAVFGADAFDSGDVFIDGKKVDIYSPRAAIQHRMALLTENRKEEGLILIDSVLNNINLATIDRDKTAVFLNARKRNEKAAELINALSIKTPSAMAPVGTLSGGNQQKVVIAKWINTHADIVIFDEPTRGIDVGAKIEVYNIMNQLIADNKCVIMISSELPEILGMSDRVIVMREGVINGEIDFDSEYFNQESIMKAAWGGTLS